MSGKFYTSSLNLGYTINTRGWRAVCDGGGPVHSGIFSSIPGFSPLDARSTLRESQQSKMSQIWPNAPWEAEAPPAEDHFFTLIGLQWFSLGGSITGDRPLFLVTRQ